MAEASPRAARRDVLRDVKPSNMTPAAEHGIELRFAAEFDQAHLDRIAELLLPFLDPSTGK